MNEASNLDLAVIGNCQVAALIDRQGRIVWMCLPKPDADPVFCALLRGEGGDSVSGVFAVDLRDLAEAQRSYVRNTAIVETILTDAQGNDVPIFAQMARAPKLEVFAAIEHPLLTEDPRPVGDENQTREGHGVS